MNDARQQTVRRRPSKLWFVLGGVLILLSLPLLAVGMIRTMNNMAETDSTFFVGEAAPVTSPAHQDRMLFVDKSASSDPDCTIVDGTGAVRDLEDLGVRVTVDNGDGAWRGLARFDSGDGDLTVTCAGRVDTLMRIGPPAGPIDVLKVMFPLFGSLALGGIGGLILVVTGILYATRSPGRQPGHH